MELRDKYLTILRSIKEQSASKYGIEAIGIFGSVARNEQAEHSDLDVFVAMSSPSYHDLCELKREIEERCKCNVDLLRLRPSLRPLLLKNIKRDGIYA